MEQPLQTQPRRPANPHRITVAAAMANAGLALDDYGALNDSVLPACCDEGCEVEPDGHCEHGCPSVLLAMGVI